ncbi:MAG: hypothetical protein IJT11_10955 [Bacteroidaceae bacterium]|nr:hypothetical protein [Bacteroidaceae bacterium]
MKITDQDIVRAAQELRDEENNQMTVRPWNRRRRHFRIPTWLASTPAAAVIGFAFGIWTQAHKQAETPLTALVDTIYIKVPVPQPPQQKAVVEAVPAYQGSAPKRTARPKQTLGRPASEDNIRYDLLVCN